MTRQKTLLKVIDYIKTAIAEHPIKDGNNYVPEIVYMNGNDGTTFDWLCNSRTCEFFVFYEGESAWGYLKVFVTNGGFITGYIWDSERGHCEATMLEAKLLYEGSDKCNAYYYAEKEAFAFKKYLCNKYDYKRIWDAVVAKI